MIGVLGSAFNPPHVGHLVLAQEAAVRLGLAEVLLVPTGVAPHKEIESDPGTEARREMTDLAAAGNALLRVEPLEVEAAARGEGPSYTYLTLEGLLERDPAIEPVLLIGADAALSLAEWRCPERIVELARLGVAMRPGVKRDAVAAALAELGPARGVDYLEMPQVGVSSTGIRERVAEGLPIRYLVPDAVVELIEARGLYRAR